MTPAEIRELEAAGCRVYLDDGVTVGEQKRLLYAR